MANAQNDSAVAANADADFYALQGGSM